MTKKDFERILKPLKVLDFPVTDSVLFDEYYSRIKNYPEWIISKSVKLIIDNETRFPKPSTLLSYMFRIRDEFGSKIKSEYNKNLQIFICQREKCGYRFMTINDGADKNIKCVCGTIYNKCYLKQCYDTQMEITDDYALEIYLGYPNPNDTLLKELEAEGLIDKFRRPISLTDYIKKLEEKIK